MAMRLWIAVFVVSAAIVVIWVGAAGDEPEVYRSRDRALTLDFSKGSQNLAASISMKLPDQVADASNAEATAQVRFQEYHVYPSRAKGTVSCAIEFSVNGAMWDRQVISYEASSPEYWHEQDDSLGGSFQMTLPVEPSFQERVKEASNSLALDVSCKSTVLARGDLRVVVTFGPIVAEIS